MSISEFDVINRFFTRDSQRSETHLSIGDDCALLSVPKGYELAITTDTMVEGMHFFTDVSAEDLGHKLLAVNLSDLASMGAEPVAMTLALTLPMIDIDWLADFSRGLFILADQYKLDLIGGDTTSGPLTLTIQAMGLVPKGKALKRSAAKVGDLIYMTGSLGDGGLGLKIKQGYMSTNDALMLQRFNRPEPRVDVGLDLLNYAHACVDISDGLIADLGHVLQKSKVGACIDYQCLPLSVEVLAYIVDEKDWQMPLNAGDDYELCFTVPKNKVQLLSDDYTCIGVIEDQQGLRVNYNGEISTVHRGGFEHFSRTV